jgi:RNA polymerase sigma-70 factor (ECF subfamily)
VVATPADRKRFESLVLLHLDAAHNLARWLTRDDANAQDAVQEASLRAWSAFDSFRGGDARAWLLTIVRNTCFTLLRRGKHAAELEEDISGQPETIAAGEKFDPQLIAARSADSHAVRAAIEQLPAVLREAIVLREMEGLDYRQIAQIAAVPIGTVMSRLSRGRRQLAQLLSERKE